MSYALMSSGGKDSTLALDRARRQGLDVRYVANIYNRPSARVAFHGVRAELIAAQASAQRLEHVAAATDPEPFEDVFVALLGTLRERGVTGVVFGNVHLADVRAWYESRVTAAGLEHVEPLWGARPADVLREGVERGFGAVVVSVDLRQGAAWCLGRTLDRELVAEIVGRGGVDPCGEHGEYHTFVYDGPTFEAPVPVTRGATVEHRGHRLLDLTLRP